jgi:hypothetical protein
VPLVVPQGQRKGLGVQRFAFTDSRGQAVQVTVSGPTHTGSAVPGQDFTKTLPEMWIARFTRDGGAGEIIIDLASPETSEAELRELLERDPEWQYDRLGAQ